MVDVVLSLLCGCCSSVLTFPHGFRPRSFARDSSGRVKVGVVALYVRNSQRKFELQNREESIYSFMEGRRSSLLSSPHNCGPEHLKIETEVLGHSLVCLLVRLHRSLIKLAPPYLLCSRAPLRLFVRSLAHFAHSLTRGTVNR